MSTLVELKNEREAYHRKLWDYWQQGVSMVDLALAPWTSTSEKSTIANLITRIINEKGMDPLQRDELYANARKNHRARNLRINAELESYYRIHHHYPPAGKLKI